MVTRIKVTMKSLSFVITAVLVFLPSVVSMNTVAGEVPQSDLGFTGQPWESGQQMFYADSFWRGGDCASSVDLGYDPSTADFNVYSRGTKEAPSAFFPSDDTSWYWPGNVVNAGTFLVVSLMHVCPSDVGLGFRECDQPAHAAYLVSDFEGVPREWTLTPLMLPDNPYGLMLGAATIIEPPCLYMFNINVKEPGDGSMYLARWHTDSLLIGSTRAIEWWAHDNSAWVPDSELSSEPTTVFGAGATEFSVIYDDKTNQYLAIQTVGFGSADVMMRTAPALIGPWSELQLIYEPAEMNKPNVVVYAAKALPKSLVQI